LVANGNTLPDEETLRQIVTGILSNYSYTFGTTSKKYTEESTWAINGLVDSIIDCQDEFNNLSNNLSDYNNTVINSLQTLKTLFGDKVGETESEFIG